MLISWILYFFIWSTSNRYEGGPSVGYAYNGRGYQYDGNAFLTQIIAYTWPYIIVFTVSFQISYYYTFKNQKPPASIEILKVVFMISGLALMVLGPPQFLLAFTDR